MKTDLLFPFPRKLATSMAAIADGITAKLMRATSGMASVNVGKNVVTRYGLRASSAMAAVVVRASAMILIWRLLFPLDSSGSRYCCRLIGMMCRNMRN